MEYRNIISNLKLGNIKSEYFAYQDITEYTCKNLNEALYKIDIQERESYNALQTKVLNSS